MAHQRRELQETQTCETTRDNTSRLRQRPAARRWVFTSSGPCSERSGSVAQRQQPARTATATSTRRSRQAESYQNGLAEASPLRGSPALRGRPTRRRRCEPLGPELAPPAEQAGRGAVPVADRQQQRDLPGGVPRARASPSPPPMRVWGSISRDIDPARDGSDDLTPWPSVVGRKLGAGSAPLGLGSCRRRIPCPLRARLISPRRVLSFRDPSRGATVRGHCGDHLRHASFSAVTFVDTGGSTGPARRIRSWPGGPCRACTGAAGRLRIERPTFRRPSAGVQDTH